MEYRNLAIFITNKCTAECEICSLRCSPKGKDILDVNRLKKILNSCKSTKIKRVTFTGGEPFIYMDNLFSLIKHCTEIGLSSSVMTNGFWAEDALTTKNIVKNLKKHGLKSMGISYDNHHKKFIPPRNINLILKAAYEYGLPTLIMVTRMMDDDLGDVINSLSSDNPNIKLVINACQPVGAAKENYDKSKFSTTIDLKDKLYCPYGNTMSIFSNGLIFPCCSHYVFDTSLNIGNYINTDIPQAIESIKKNTDISSLIYYGLNSILDKDVINEPLNRFACECEICSKIFNKQN